MRRGFTLLEIIVAIGLFTIVAFLTTGSLLILNNAQRKAFFIQTNQDNVRFTLESMAREIRTGVNYTLLNPPPSQFNANACSDTPLGACFGFTNAQKPNQYVVYKLSSSTIQKSVDGGVIFQPITAPEVFINNLRFYIAGASLTDNFQSRVTIVIQAITPGADPNSSRLDVQTTVNRLRRDTAP